MKRTATLVVVLFVAGLLLVSGCGYGPVYSRYPYYAVCQTYSTSDYAFYRVPTYPYYRVPAYPGGHWWGGWFPYGRYGYDVVDYVPARTGPVVLSPF